MRDKTAYYIVAVGITIAALILVLAGCAKVRFKDDEVYYSRFGKQTLEGVTFTKQGNNISLSFDKQDGDAGVLGEALNEAIKRIPVTP